MLQPYFSKWPTYLLQVGIALCFLLSTSTGSKAQKLDMEKLKALKPRAIGPAGMSGRITAIDARVDNPNIIYTGSASGGLWMSKDGGISWKPIFDDQKAASIGAVKIAPSNPDIVWVGTGEGNPRNSSTGGYGIYKSLDGGQTWVAMGLEKTRNIHRILIHPDNPDVVFVAAIGSPWGDHPERGVYKTTDGGKTWNKVLFINERTGAADLVMDPQNPNKLIVAMWEHHRDPWFFKSGGKGSGMYITHDGGNNWKQVTAQEGLPEGDLGRIGLAFAPSKPEIVYAIVEAKKNGFYKSENGGRTWKKVTDKGDFGNRPFYYSEIYVDPQNENRIYSLYTYISKSEDGGRTWKQIANYGNRVHPDHHAYWINPQDPDLIMNGNDGGMFISRDGGDNWRFVDNIPVGQFYHINVDMDYPYNVYGGMQDNGSWKGPAYVWKYAGIRNSYWQEINFGDGFDAVVDPSDPEFVYTMSQQGFVTRRHWPTGDGKSVRPVHPEGTFLRYNWNAAIALDPFDTKTVYFGSQFVHKSTDQGSTWEIISPDLTSNDPEKQKQTESGGITYDATGAENFTTILCITPSPLEEGLLWVGTDDGQVQITRDGGKTWNNVIKNIKGVPAGTWIPQIKASSYKAGEAFVVFEDHRRDNWTPYVYHTEDYGKTWTRIVDENKVWGYALAIVQDPVAPNLLFLGTEFGLYVSIDKGQNWTPWTNDYPTVSTMDLVIHPREHDLVIGTFGRAIFVLDDIRPLREMAQEGLSLLDKPVHAFAPPEAVMASYLQAAGSRFSAQGMFSGKNRPEGAMITFALKDVKMKGKPVAQAEGEADPSGVEPSGTQEAQDIQAEKADTMKIKMEVLNSQKEVIRSREFTPKPGLNRVSWGLDRKSIRMESWRSRRNNNREPGGIPVVPGTYTVRFTYGEDKDSTQIKVIADPRRNWKLSDMQAKQVLIDEMLEEAKKFNKAVKQLKEADETIQLVSKNMKGKDEASQDLKKRGKALRDTIESYLVAMIGRKPGSFQGIYRNPDVLSAKVGGAMRGLGGNFEALSQREKLLVAQAKAALKPALEKVNAFFAKDWKDFREAVEAQKFSVFKDYSSIE